MKKFIYPSSATVLTEKNGKSKKQVVTYYYDNHTLTAHFIGTVGNGFYVGNAICLN
jgi:hypothetical protein